MDPKEFTSTSAGRIIRTPTGYDAFVPAPLPPQIAYGSDLVVLLSQADSALSELSGLGRYVPNPDLLIAPYVKREALASSRIEGTRAELTDLLFYEIGPVKAPRESDVLEVRNYIRALNAGISKLDTLPMAGRLVREMHAILMKGVRGQEKSPGEFRRTQNWIGPPGCTLAEALYVPPPPEEMHECLKHWENYLNERGAISDLVQCALIHAQFESIHPFLDGNGRIGRLLVVLFLIERKRLSKPLLYLSSYFEQHKSNYYAFLQRIRTHGDWAAWLRFFLIAIRDTSRSTIGHSESILALREKYLKKLHNRHKAAILVDELFKNPYTTVSRAAERLGVTAPTAFKTIAELEKIGMLHEVTGKEWGRMWLAKPIFDAFSKSEMIQPSTQASDQSTVFPTG